MQIVSHETVIVNHPPTAMQLRQLGWNAYCNGLPLESLTTDHERRGWIAANRAEAETRTDGWAESQGW